MVVVAVANVAAIAVVAITSMKLYQVPSVLRSIHT
jgi:hypothetical protein